jgi:hypothetical protein
VPPPAAIPDVYNVTTLATPLTIPLGPLSLIYNDITPAPDGELYSHLQCLLPGIFKPDIQQLDGWNAPGGEAICAAVVTP